MRRGANLSRLVLSRSEAEGTTPKEETQNEIFLADNNIAFRFPHCGAVRGKLFSENRAIVSATGTKAIPQAPRISPDGKKMLYELYTPSQCEIWLCDSDGQNAIPLTRDLQATGKIWKKVENGFWHPSQNYIAFNGAPEGIRRDGPVYIASLQGGKIGEYIQLGPGARPQFSKPNGHVVFYEATFLEERGPGYREEQAFYNTLAYRILGKNPLKPVDNTSIELRGPIQAVARNVELSHPSLAPDGTTILFAARTAATGGALSQMDITDSDRQRAFELWKRVVSEKVNQDILKKEVEACTERPYGLGLNDLSLDSDEISFIKGNMGKLRSQATVVKGFNRKDFLICWLMGMLAKLDPEAEGEMSSYILSRVWMTDVFGAPIVPLVEDNAHIPLPQKWATVSHSGKFAVFEAGYYQNRHLYLVNLKTRKAVKLTEEGTYNSSPEISPDEQWIYFESNRNGGKAIWRAQLDRDKIGKELNIE